MNYLTNPNLNLLTSMGLKPDMSPQLSKMKRQTHRMDSHCTMHKMLSVKSCISSISLMTRSMQKQSKTQAICANSSHMKGQHHQILTSKRPRMGHFFIFNSIRAQKVMGLKMEMVMATVTEMATEMATEMEKAIHIRRKPPCCATRSS